MSNQLFYRTYELDRGLVNKEERSIDVSFSSETPYTRWFGKEILLHGSENIDLSRLKKMGSVLMNHNPDTILGRPKDIRVEDKRGKAKIVFDDDEDGNKALSKVEAGSLKGMSVGYVVNKFREVKEDEEWNGIKGPAYVATRWQPYEISLTPIPADATVGIGRAATRSLEGIEIETTNKQEVNDMTIEEVKAVIEEARKEDQAKIATLITEGINKALENNNKPQIRITADELNELMGKAVAISPEAEAKVARMVGEGKEKVEILDGLLELARGAADSTNTKKGDGSDGKNKGELTFEKIDNDIFYRSFMSPEISFN